MSAPSKAAKGSKLQVATSNDLMSGDVVFLAPDNTWARDINAARIADGKEDSAALLEDANAPQHQGVIVGAYLCAVAIDADTGHPYPLHYREIMRVTGPSHDHTLAHTH